MCEALASTGALKALLTALRGHVGHEGVIAATCKVLLAFQEEFGANGCLPLQLSKALRSSEALVAMEQAQRRFPQSQTIQLGAELAIGLSRADGRGAYGPTVGPWLMARKSSPRRMLQPLQAASPYGI